MRLVVPDEMSDTRKRTFVSQRMGAVFSAFGALAFLMVAIWAMRDLLHGNFHVHSISLRWGDGAEVTQISLVCIGSVLALVFGMRAVAKWRAAKRG